MKASHKALASGWLVAAARGAPDLGASHSGAGEGATSGSGGSGGGGSGMFSPLRRAMLRAVRTSNPPVAADASASGGPSDASHGGAYDSSLLAIESRAYNVTKDREALRSVVAWRHRMAVLGSKRGHHGSDPSNGESSLHTAVLTRRVSLQSARSASDTGDGDGDGEEEEGGDTPTTSESGSGSGSAAPIDPQEFRSRPDPMVELWRTAGNGLPPAPQLPGPQGQSALPWAACAMAEQSNALLQLQGAVVAETTGRYGVLNAVGGATHPIGLLPRLAAERVARLPSENCTEMLSDPVVTAFQAALEAPDCSGVLPAEYALQAPPVVRAEHHRSMQLDASSPLVPRPGSWYLVALEDGSLVAPGWQGWDLGAPYPSRSRSRPDGTVCGPRAVALVTGWMCDACVRCGSCGGRANGEAADEASMQG